MKQILSLLLILWVNSLLIPATRTELPNVIPFTLYGDHMFVKVGINGVTGLDFIFDTGASSTIIDSRIAGNMGLTKGSETVVIGAGGRNKIKYYNQNRILLGGIEFTNQTLAVSTLDHLSRRIGKKIDGIVGYPILINYALKLDFDEKKITLYPPMEPHPVLTGQRLMLKIADIQIPYIMAKIEPAAGKRLYGYFLLDTGAGHTLIINTPFSSKYDLPRKIGNHYPVNLTGLTKQHHPSHMGRIGAMAIGRYRLENVPVACSQARDGVNSLPQYAGIIGSVLLKHFNIYLNIQKKFAVFQPSAAFFDPFELDCSGLRIGLDLGDSRIIIFEVISGSPGDLAGLEIGDKLIIVNGKWMNPDSLMILRKKFRKPNERISVVVRRHARLIPFVFYTKELI